MIEDEERVPGIGAREFGIGLGARTPQPIYGRCRRGCMQELRFSWGRRSENKPWVTPCFVVTKHAVVVTGCQAVLLCNIFRGELRLVSCREIPRKPGDILLVYKC